VNSQFTILNPCSKRWTELSGSGRARFCETCKTPVHDFARYSPKEWEQVWRENTGHVCGVLTPPPMHQLRNRRSILIGTLLTIVSPLMAQSGRIRIRVIDSAGSAIAGAEVLLLAEGGQPARTLLSDDHGEVIWNDLPLGNNKFRVAGTGFLPLLLTVTARSGIEVRADAALNPFIGELVPGNYRHKRKHWWIFW